MLPFVKNYFTNSFKFLHPSLSNRRCRGQLAYPIICAALCQALFTKSDFFFRTISQQREGPLSRPLSRCFLFGIINQSITTVVAFINNREGSAVVLIPEGKEVVIQQIHLHHRFLTSHWLEVELFAAHDAQIFLRIRHERGFLLNTADESILLKAAGKAGLVLANLPLNGCNRGVNGGKPIRCALACPEPGAGTMHGQLHPITVLLNRKDDQGLRILVKKALQLHYLLLSISADIAGQFDFLFSELEFHMRQLLSYYR